jgi:hypothetical protein
MNFLKSILVGVVIVFSQNLLAAECWITENYMGVAAKNRNNLAFEQDGMTKTKYIIYIDGEKSKIVGSTITTYLQTAENAIIAIDIKNGSSVVETWSVNPASKKALYTKTINGYGEFDGISSFVGDVVGSCKSEMEIKK